MRGIENTLYQSSYLPILTDVHNERSRFERYLEMLLDRRVEALIVLANWLFLDINLLGDLEKSSMPDGDDRLRTQDRLDQFGHRRQRSRRLHVRWNICIRSGIARLHSFADRRRLRTVRRDGAEFAIAPRSTGWSSISRLILDLPESRDPMSSFESGHKLTEELIRQKTPLHRAAGV